MDYLKNKLGSKKNMGIVFVAVASLCLIVKQTCNYMNSKKKSEKRNINLDTTGLHKNKENDENDKKEENDETYELPR